MGAKTKDLTGRVFGRWVVLGRAEDTYSPKGHKVIRWKCQCQCCDKTIRDVSASSLRTGKSVSCGCYQKEIATQTITKARKKYNDYVAFDNHVILYTSKNEPFLVDIEDFGRIRKYCWRKNEKGYICTTIDHTTVYLHRMIMNFPLNLDVDHIHGENTRYDCRKSNLRLATISQNNMNKNLQSNNTSGCTGVSWNKKTLKWKARIQVDYKSITIGFFDDLQDAIDARKEAEEKYFGRFSYDNSQRIGRAEEV